MHSSQKCKSSQIVARYLHSCIPDLIFLLLLSCAVSIHSKSVDMGSAQHKSLASAKKKAPKGMYVCMTASGVYSLNFLTELPV